MVHYASVSTSTVLTTFPKRITIYSLISDLLNSPCKAHIYSKIDLYHAYYLVCITNGDE